MPINDEILDNSITHQIELQYYANGIVRKILAIIARSDADLISQLQLAIERLPANSFTVTRLDAQLKSLRELNQEIYKNVSNEINNELRDLAEYEAGFQKQLFDSIPVQITIATISAEQVYSAAIARPFQGKLLKEWIQGLEKDKATRVRDAIRIGYIENQTIAQIVQRIRGTRALQYNDGILDITKRNAETIVRTAISHIAAFTRERFFEKNSQVIKALKWSSTLDGKTSEPCRARDGKLYTISHNPIGHSLNWGGGPGNYHFGCRSVSVGVTKSWKELGLNSGKLSTATRASMDGQVPADLTYEEWLKKKPASFQDDVLGKSKGKLFRAGLSLDRFENNKGKELTLSQMRANDIAIFNKAGI